MILTISFYYFRGYTEDFRLHEDDLEAIDMLYGHLKRDKKVTKNEFKSTTPVMNLSAITSQLPEIMETTTKEPDIFKENTTPEMSIDLDAKNEGKHLCYDGRFDAISVLSDNNTYIFKDKYVYKIGEDLIFYLKVQSYNKVQSHSLKSSSLEFDKNF